MAKLYWRVKRDGKWKWEPAKVVYFSEEEQSIEVEMLGEVE
jgi:hypothetical protein